MEKLTVGVGTPIKESVVLNGVYNDIKTNKIIDFKSTGQKFDSEKTRMDLLMCGCAKSLEQVAKVLTFGAKKYADDNWRLVPDAKKRYHAALHRHLNAYYQGEKTDKETGLSHLAHALCCLHFLMEFEVNE